MTVLRRAPILLAGLLAAILLLSACDDGGDFKGGEAMEETITVTGSRIAASAPPPPPPPAPVRDGDFAANSPSVDAAGDPAAQAPEGMLLAYSWAVGFELPVRNVAALKDMHEAECRAAGPRLCLVLGGSSGGDGQEFAYANLSLRAEPAWLENFRAGLAEDAESANGRISNQSVSAEDLTRSIVDTEARLTAQETLRDRLVALLDRPTDEVDDLLAVERELARVQGGIDSMRSQLAVMRARVDMSELSLSYSSLRPAVSTGAFSPVMDALRGFLSVLSGSLAWVITFIAASLPIVVILIPLAIIVWRLFRGWRRKRRETA